MLQKLLQFLQILRQVDQNWYIDEDMNGKQQGKFSSVDDSTIENICKSFKWLLFLTHPVSDELSLTMLPSARPHSNISEMSRPNANAITLQFN